MKIVQQLFVLAALIGFNIVNAQQKSEDTTVEYFMIQVSIGNLQEIAEAKLASERGMNTQIKAFAKRMIDDHSAAQAQVMQLIKAKNLQVPHQATDTPVQDLMLKNASGKDFDRLYVHMMVPVHRETIALFQKYSLSGKDPDVRAFAEQTLPILKEHLAAITAIDEKMKDAAAK